MEAFIYQKFSIQPYFAESLELRFCIYNNWKKKLSGALHHVLMALESSFQGKDYSLNSQYMEEILDMQETEEL